MVYPKLPLAQSIIQIFAAKGIKNIIISPGSRNAPLTLGFANNPDFNCYSIADERCAAFFALGIAQQTEQPSAVVCTSGSALLNYYPAVAEAFYSQIPLIVLSADRPQNKIDIGDGQTIRQENVFRNHSLFNANLKEDSSLENDLKINKAINAAILKKGPVHINAPFEEPLYLTTMKMDVESKIILRDAKEPKISTNKCHEFAKIWNNSKKKLVLVGANLPNNIEPDFIEFLANDKSVVVMTEKTSNLHEPTFISSIETIITPFSETEFKELQPDILITFGGMVVSKRIKAFLRNYKPKHHWHIDPLRAYDTYGCLTQHFKVETNCFFKQFIPFTLPIESDYCSYFDKVSKYRALMHKNYMNKISFSDLKVFDKILATIPADSMIQFSNSSVIRYAQLFQINPTIQIFCNRGTSGIDGSTSTAIGAAVANENQTVLITGDISFLYDSNALWNDYIPKNFKIILINNGGGGIFRILPGHEETKVFNTFFETSHCLTAEHLARMYGFEYSIASNEAALETSLQLFYSNINKPSILEVFTPTLQNDKILSQYFKELV